MKYALFLGCSIPVRSLGYEMAVRRVSQELGIELIDVPGFRCCGYPVKSLDQYTAMVLAARNLALAEQNGLVICTLCNACTGSLTEADLELKEDAELRERVNRDLAKVGLKYQGTTKVQHFLRVLDEEIGAENLQKKILKRLNGFKVATHYGCHYLKPTRVYHHYGFRRVEEPELPKALDSLIELTGITSVPYPGKNDCCGGGLQAVNQQMGLKLAGQKVETVLEVGAEALAVACPTCALMFGNSQGDEELPVVFFPQLLGLAMGLTPVELGFEQNQVPADELLERWGV